jgi:rare lipoprotein A
MVKLMAVTVVASLLWVSPSVAQAPKVSLAPWGKRVSGYVGLASWYGGHHQGRKMANGKPFDRKKLTAACWNLPLGTVIQVVNLRNGKSVVVTVTDRGPHPRLKRVLDLSEAAAVKLDYVHDGLTKVYISRLASVSPEQAKVDASLIEPSFEAQVPVSKEGVSSASLF